MTTATTTTTTRRLSPKENEMLDRIKEGMDHAGEGWFHELTATATPTHSECAVLGSLIKKGWVNSEDDDGCSWITLGDTFVEEMYRKTASL